MSIDIHPPRPTVPLLTPPEAQQQELVVTGGAPRYSLIDHEANKVTVMSSLSVLSQVSPETERRFRLHAERWYVDTLRLSSYFEKILHPDYQKILVLGTPVVPLILRELEDMPNDWFWALQMLTDADPVEEHQTGDMQAMANAWLKWGHDEGYI